MHLKITKEINDNTELRSFLKIIQDELFFNSNSYIDKALNSLIHEFFIANKKQEVVAFFGKYGDRKVKYKDYSFLEFFINYIYIDIIKNVFRMPCLFEKDKINVYCNENALSDTFIEEIKKMEVFVTNTDYIPIENICETNLKQKFNIMVQCKIKTIAPLIENDNALTNEIMKTYNSDVSHFIKFKHSYLF